MHKNHHMEQLEDGRQLDVDEQWFAAWVEYGIEEITVYLRRHAQFDAYLRQTGRS